MKAHAINGDDVQVALDEMKEAMSGVVKSAGNVVRSIDWKSTVPKAAAGLVLLYSIRNKKMAGIMTSLVLAGVSGYINNRIEAKGAHKET